MVSLYQIHYLHFQIITFYVYENKNLNTGQFTSDFSSPWKQFLSL